MLNFLLDSCNRLKGTMRNQRYRLCQPLYLPTPNVGVFITLQADGDEEIDYEETNEDELIEGEETLEDYGEEEERVNKDVMGSESAISAAGAEEDILKEDEDRVLSSLGKEWKGLY